MAEPDLPLTIPVNSIVASALHRLRELDGLDRDEAYLLARLERAGDEAGGALLDAIEETT